MRSYLRTSVGSVAVLGLAMSAALIFSDLAQAGPVYASVWAGDYTNSVRSGDHTWDTSQPWSGDVVSSSTVSSQAASAANGGTYKGATTSSSGSANLATAQLKGTESAVLAPGALASNAEAWVSSAFGDSFSVFGPSGPFSWTSANTVRFTLTVNGHIGSSSPGGDQVFVEFYYGAPGALANNGTGGGAEFPAGLATGNFYPQDGCFFPLGFPGQNVVGMTCGGTLTENASGDVSGTVFAEFAPNGNFDWVADLTLQGWPGSLFSPGPGTSSMNFSDTVTVGYIGPEGTTTDSASGVFPGTLALATTVPEPSTFALVGLGMILVAARRVKRQTGNTC